MPGSRTVALVDPFWNGHHPTYMRLFSKSLLELSCRVMAFCPAPLELSEWVETTSPGQSVSFAAFELHDPEPVWLPTKRLRKARFIVARWHRASQAIKRAASTTGCEPDLVFFPWLDNYLCGVPRLSYVCAAAVNFVFRHRWSGLYFMPTNLRLGLSVANRWKGFDTYRLLRSSRCQAVAILDEGVMLELRLHTGETPIVPFPDVADSAPPDRAYSLAQDIKKRANGRKIIGLVGALRRAKGVLTLLKVARQAIDQDWFFFMAGRVSEHTFLAEELERINRACHSPDHNFYLYPDYVPQESQLNALVEICDVVFAAYEDFYHSSNILTKAAMFQKPVLVSEGSCMDERVKRYLIGLSAPARDVDAYIRALSVLTAEGRYRAEVGEPNFEGYAREHSVERLRMAFQDILSADGRD